MAEDLTPPAAQTPAPAPAPATDLVSAHEEPVGREITKYEPRVAPPHRRRFRLMFGLLGLLVGGAVVGTVAIALGGSHSSPSDTIWSSWRPADGGLKGAQEIANHVAPTYRLADGKQLVAVSGGPLEFARLPATVALRAEPGGQNIEIVPGDGILYTLCGLGENCAIRTGKPSQERHLLLRREALELALYSFRYINGVDSVVVLLPPRRGQQPSQAMLFRNGDLNDQVDRPLRATLPTAPSTPDRLTTTDVTVVQRLTTPRLYNFRLQQGQDATVFLVLDPLAR